MTKDGGAASAAPLSTITSPADVTLANIDALEAQATAAISLVRDAEQADDLLRRVTCVADAARTLRLAADQIHVWSVLKLKAERRYGELLGPAHRGRTHKRTAGATSVTGSNTSADRAAQHKAHQVAAVPPEEFEEYVNTAENPSRAGLLNREKATDRRTGPNWKTEREAIIAWVDARAADGETRREPLMEQAARGLYDWPWPDKILPRQTLDKAQALLAERARAARAARQAPKKKGPTESGKKLRSIPAQRDYLSELRRAMWKVVGVLEDFDIGGVEWTPEVEQEAAFLWEDLERVTEWLDRTKSETALHMRTIDLQRRLGVLRQRAKDPSSTEHERATAAELAATLERRLHARIAS